MYVGEVALQSCNVFPQFSYRDVIERERHESACVRLNNVQVFNTSLFFSLKHTCKQIMQEKLEYNPLCMQWHTH